MPRMHAYPFTLVILFLLTTCVVDKSIAQAPVPNLMWDEGSQQPVADVPFPVLKRVIAGEKLSAAELAQLLEEGRSIKALTAPQGEQAQTEEMGTFACLGGCIDDYNECRSRGQDIDICAAVLAACIAMCASPAPTPVPVPRRTPTIRPAPVPIAPAAE